MARPARRLPGRFMVLAAAVALATIVSMIATHSAGEATSGGDPYSVPPVIDTNPSPDVVETTLVSEEATVDIGNGVSARAQTFNGSLPGPTFRLKVGDTVIVRYENRLSRPSGIHWHGIELPNAMDGTAFTQNQVAPNGTFLYKFQVNRPGVFWYHPHHHASTNQVFKGMYGMIVVEDPNEGALQASGALPSPAQTKPIVLSDTTVCKAPPSNDTATYDPASPHVSGGALPAQAPPTPKDLCETSPIDEDGAARGAFAAGDIPNVQSPDPNGMTNEGQTVLANGKNVGARAGTPSAPGALAAGASKLDVQAGQGVRLQLVNAATIRFFRLRLTTSTGALVRLVRIGGEGGLLDNAVLEGGVQSTPAAFDTKYSQGEILIPPGGRADVVAAIPAAATGVLTLWTEDFARTAMGFANTPTVPVMHFNVTGVASSAYAIGDGTPLRAATGDPVAALGPATGSLLDPSTFAPAKPGRADQSIRFTSPSANQFGVDGVFGTHDVAGDYSDAAHLGSTRYAKVGDTLELTVENLTGQNHPFHPHGFSIQPLALLSRSTNEGYVWPYKELRDTIDIPPQHKLVFRMKIDDRPLPDETTSGGALGRWNFHCHIFSHAVNGMISELVVVKGDGNERPDVNVDGASVEVNQGETATVSGTFKDRENDPVTLTSSVGTVTKTAGRNWTWMYPTGIDDSSTRLVYVTATDSNGLKSQVPFYLKTNAAAPSGGGAGPPGKPPVGGAARPAARIALTRLSVTNRRFAVGSTRTPLASARRRARRGTTFRFKLSKPGRVAIVIDRRVSGRRAGAKCVRQTRRNRRAKRCMRAVRMGTLTRTGVLGSNRVAFSGRVGRRPLRPGSYRARARATDAAGSVSLPASVRFSVVAR